MNAWNDVAVDPDDRFATRLEAALVSALHGSATSISTPTNQQGDMMVITLDEPTHDVRPPRSRWLAMVAAAVLVVGAGALFVLRRDDSAPASGEADVTFEIQWPGLAAHGSNRCITTEATYESAASGHCLRGSTGEARFTGDIDGTAIFDMAANLGDDPAADEQSTNLATFNATYLVRGTVVGCGTGEFMIAELLQFVGWENGAFVGTWQVMPGSGRGELAGIGGSGEVPGDPGGGRDEAPRTHTGVIDCG